MVATRSAAETPVPVLTWSTGIVKAVRCASVFSIDISGSRSSSRRPDSIGTQTMPVPCLTMNDIWATVSDSAATTISHSFSRCSSSITTIIRPSASAATARLSAATPASAGRQGWGRPGRPRRAAAPGSARRPA